MNHGFQCPCFRCVTEGDTRCSRTCVLRFGHAGEHAGWARFAVMFARVCDGLYWYRFDGKFWRSIHV